MRAISLVSGKGGVGKTTTAVNLGIALNMLGKEVIIVDGNVSTPNVGLSLGAPVVPFALQHALLDKRKVEKAIYVHDSGTKIIPSSFSFRDEVQLKNLKGVISKAKSIGDLVIIDSAAGINEEVMHTINASDECIIVTNPEMLAVSTALKAIRKVEERDKKILGIIVNKVTGKNEMTIRNVSKLLEYPIIGVVPEDKKVKRSLINKEPVIISYPHSRAAREFKQIARHIIGKGRNDTHVGNALSNVKDFISGLAK